MFNRSIFFSNLDKTLNSVIFIILTYFFVCITSTFVFGGFFFDKRLLFFDIVLFLTILFYFKDEIGISKNLQSFLIFSYIVFIIFIALSTIYNFPLWKKDFTRYHLRIPITWVLNNGFYKEPLFLEQSSIWGVQHVIYSRFYLIFEKLHFSLIYNYICTFLLLPSSIYLVLGLVDKNSKLLNLSLAFIPLTYNYVLNSSYSGDNSIFVFVYFLFFVYFFEKYILTKKFIYIYLLSISIIFCLMEKITGIFFVPIIIIYSFFRTKNFKINFTIIFSIILGSLKFLINYYLYKSFFYPLYKSVPFIKQKLYDYHLDFNISCIEYIPRRCLLTLHQVNSSILNFIESFRLNYAIFFDLLKNQLTKEFSTGIFFDFLILITSILFLIAIVKITIHFINDKL